MSILVGLVLVAAALAVLGGMPAAFAGGNANALRSLPTASGPLTSVQGASIGPASIPPSYASYFHITPQPMSTLQPTAPMQITLGLQAPGLPGVEQSVNNPSSPFYRQYLTNQQVQGLGIDLTTYTSLVTYLQSFGLTVAGDRLALQVSGTVAQVQAALHTTFGAYQETYSGPAWNPMFERVTGYDNATNQVVWSSAPRTFYSNTAPVRLPAGLAAAVSGITGLDGSFVMPQVQTPAGLAPGVYPDLVNESTFTPASRFVSSTSAGGAASVNLATGAANYTWLTYRSFFGSNREKVQLFFPSTMATLTGSVPMWTGSSALNSARDYGQGVTIAVIEVGCVNLQTLSDFSKVTFGDPNQLLGRTTFIGLGATGVGSSSGFSFDPRTCVGQGLFWGWDVETALDIEYAATIAPEAHIDVLSVPSAFFTAFDAAYQFAAQHLVGGGQCNIPARGPAMSAYPGYFPAVSNVLVYGSLTDVYGGSACGVSITSNSYGAGESTITYLGTSMYLTVENELLGVLGAEGVSSFFASGDSGGVFFTVEDFMPADAPAVTSVGGAQITAVSGQQKFPNTGTSTFLTEEEECFFGECFQFGALATLAPVTGIDSMTYWSYGFGIGGTFTGAVGGGFGASASSPQGWWQNGLDTYSTGARVDPQVSGQAAFNMTIFYEQCFNYGFFSFCLGPWLFIYGGTSFASPITAGQFALVEEQAQVAYGTHSLGEANALLYAAHNAWEAGASTINPFTPMMNIGVDNGVIGDYAPTNSFTWYYENLSIQVPDDIDHPSWFPTLYNPAVPPGWIDGTHLGGSSLWNNLQGVGIPDTARLDKVLIGQFQSDRALTNAPFVVEIVNPDGSLSPITTLVGGQTYTLQIVSSLGGNPTYTVNAYSGTANDGMTYGGGTPSQPGVGSNLQFAYMPTWNDPRGAGYATSATTYGYFRVQASTGVLSHPQWFQAFAVAPPMSLVIPSLCVTDAYGVCQTANAEVTMFHTYDLIGFYNLQGAALGRVTLNGLPVEGATVVQTSVATNGELLDPTLDPSTYAPGATIGMFVTDARGIFEPWVNAFIAENNGPLPTQVFTVTAFVNGVPSNTVTVYVEPQGGTLLPSLHLGPNGHVVGTLQWNDLTNLESVGVSIGTGRGQTQSEVFDPGPKNGIATIDLTQSAAQISGEVPTVATITAVGWNDLSFSFCFFGFCFSFPDVQNPIVWQDPVVLLNGALSSTAPAGATVTGDVTMTYKGTAFAGATGTLSLVSGAGTTVLATGLSGTYTLDTTKLADGWYQVVYTVTAPGAISATQSTTLYAGNVITGLQTQVTGLTSQVSALQGELASANTALATAQAQITTLQSELASADATIAKMQAQITSLQGTITQLNGQIGSLNTQISSLQGQVSTLQSKLAEAQSTNSADATTIGALQTELSSSKTTIASLQTAQANLQTQVASLQQQVADLQSQLNAKAAPSPFWNQVPGGPGGVLLIIVLVAAVVGGLTVGLRRRRSSKKAAGRMDATDGGIVLMDPRVARRIVKLRKEVARIQHWPADHPLRAVRIHAVREELLAIRGTRMPRDDIGDEFSRI